VIGSAAADLHDEERKRGQVQFAGTARRVLRTNWTCPLFHSRPIGSAAFSRSYFRDHNDETNAAQVERSLSAWRRLRDQTLLDQARICRDLAQTVVSGPAAAYGITAAVVGVLTAKIGGYAAAVTAPQQSIAARKSLTAQMRDKFNAVEARFEALDCLIPQFNTTEAGRQLIAAYETSRIIRDLGVGPSPTPPQPTPPSP